MAWTVPEVAVDGAPLTAAHLNLFARDNMLVTEAGQANIPGSYFISTGLNTVVEKQLGHSVISTGQPEGVATTSPTNLSTVGPTVTLTTNKSVMILMSVQLYNDYTGASIPNGNVTFAITGATDKAATTEQWTAMSVAFKDNKKIQFTGAFMYDTLNPGSNTFTMKYWNGGGLGTTWFTHRSMTVMAF